MFKFARQREVLWPVTIEVPVDGGTTEVHEITVRYRLLDKTERDALSSISSDEEALQFLVDRITDWDGVANEDGQPLEFSEENLRALLTIPYVERPITVGLLKASAGAPAKNS